MITRLKYKKNGNFYYIPKIAINADMIVQIVIGPTFNILFERYPDYKRVYVDKAPSIQQAKRKVRKKLQDMGLVFGAEIRRKK